MDVLDVEGPGGSRGWTPLTAAGRVAARVCTRGVEACWGGQRLGGGNGQVGGGGASPASSRGGAWLAGEGGGAQGLPAMWVV